LAQLDEHVVQADHQETLGESIRVLSVLPAVALSYSNADPADREALARCLTQGGALCLRVVLSARNLPTPTPAGTLDLLDRNPVSGVPLDDWIEKDALWGRVANVMFHTGESAHVTHEIEADCIGSLATLAACIEFMGALDSKSL
jgi:hypothetical protein